MSTLKVDTIESKTLNGDITVSSPLSGSGASLTNLPAANLTGTVADARISTLTASKLTGALPAISGASLTNLPGGGLSDEWISVYRSGTQSLATSTSTQVQWNAEIADPGSDFDSTSGYDYVVPTTGRYLINSQVVIESISGDSQIWISIYINGSQVHFTRLSTPIATSPSVHIAAILDLTAGQSVEIWAMHNTSSARNVASGNDRSFLMIQRLT
jgi:hypothetical protein